MTDNRRLPIYDRPDEFLQMGLGLVVHGKGEGAITMTRNSLAARPADPLLRELAQAITTKGIPEFHGDMLRDIARNAVYRRAIEAAAPGRRVLDIGTGSGLLAMMAARAGATHVHACEGNPMLAATARDIIAANGLADRITVHPVHSSKLDRMRDLGGGAELVITEIFSEDFLGEQVLQALRHARAHLCVPGADILPQAGAIRVALADYAELDEHVSDVEGFDLSLFNRHIDRKRPMRQTKPGLILRSDATDLFSFDFKTETALTEQRCVQLASQGGRVGGIVQWLRLDAAPGLAYENQPGPGACSHWPVNYHHLPVPVETGPGDLRNVHGWRDENTLRIWSEG
jgi:type III protein arginine methyltransferase